MSKWDDLRILLVVSRCGQASKAADQLKLSHATVSRRIAEMERAYGANLIDRSGLAWILTPLGQQLSDLAADMEAGALEAQRLVEAHSNTLEGVVRISVPRAAFALVVAPALAELSHRYPNIQLAISLDDELVSLPERKADIAVRFTFEPDPALIGEKVREVQWGLFANPKLADDLYRQKKNSTSLLPKANLILSALSDDVPLWALRNFEPTKVTHYVYGFAEKAALAAAGFGVVAMPVIVGEAQFGLQQLKWADYQYSTHLWVLANTDTRTSKRIGLVKRELVRGLRAQN